MTLDEMMGLGEQLRVHWRTNEYETAVRRIQEVLDKLDPLDEGGFAFCLGYLSFAYSRMDRDDLASGCYEDGLKRFPYSDDIRRRLASHLWTSRNAPAESLAVLEAAPAVAPDPSVSGEAQESLLIQRILNLSLHVRLLAATGRLGEAVELLRTIPPMLPPFHPMLGYLFDMEMIGELLQAGVLDPAMADIANRVTEPSFLVNGLTAQQFAGLKAYVNGPEFGGTG